MEETTIYAFAMNDKFNVINMCKWIIDSRTRQHMTPHRKTFDAYKSIDVRKKKHEKWWHGISCGQRLHSCKNWNEGAHKENQNQGCPPCAQVVCKFAISEQVGLERTQGEFQHDKVCCENAQWKNGGNNITKRITCIKLHAPKWMELTWPLWHNVVQNKTCWDYGINTLAIWMWEVWMLFQAW